MDVCNFRGDSIWLREDMLSPLDNTQVQNLRQTLRGQSKRGTRSTRTTIRSCPHNGGKRKVKTPRESGVSGRIWSGQITRRTCPADCDVRTCCLQLRSCQPPAHEYLLRSPRMIRLCDFHPLSSSEPPGRRSPVTYRFLHHPPGDCSSGRLNLQKQWSAAETGSEWKRVLLDRGFQSWSVADSVVYYLLAIDIFSGLCSRHLNWPWTSELVKRVFTMLLQILGEHCTTRTFVIQPRFTNNFRWGNMRLVR